MRIKRSKGRVVAAMSGGVDSSLAAAILKKRGFDCVGITFRTWPKNECGASFSRTCCSLEAITMARAVAERLDMPYYVLDISERFRREVVDYFAAEYSKGRTPNPCIVCNEKIKFGFLIERAKSLGAGHVATGHFAKIDYDKRTGRYLLKEGKDKKKDQSYFLFSLSQAQLARALFPLGDMTKTDVRRRARRLKLPSHNALSSQDICFVQDMNYRDYLKKKMSFEIMPGDIVDSSGKILGRHKGIPFYTIGQRRGLGVTYKEPLYVTGLDVINNRVVVGVKKDILKRSLVANRMNWIEFDAPDGPVKVKAKIRYNHKGSEAVVTPLSADEVRVDFDAPQEAPTPGQAVVFYDKDIVVGGGWIRDCPRSVVCA